MTVLLTWLNDNELTKLNCHYHCVFFELRDKPGCSADSGVNCKVKLKADSKQACNKVGQFLRSMIGAVFKSDILRDLTFYDDVETGCKTTLFSLAGKLHVPGALLLVDLQGGGLSRSGSQQ